MPRSEQSTQSERHSITTSHMCSSTYPQDLVQYTTKLVISEEDTKFNINLCIPVIFSITNATYIPVVVAGRSRFSLLGINVKLATKTFFFLSQTPVLSPDDPVVLVSQLTHCTESVLKSPYLYL